MKTSVSFYTFSQDVDIREAACEAKKAGYDGVELCLSETGQLNMKTTRAGMLSIRAMIEDMGLEVSAVGAWNLWEHNLAGEDLKDAAYAVSIVEKQIEAANAFGTDAILVVPGWVGTNFAPGIVRYDRAYENSQKRLSGLVPLAEAAPLEVHRFIDEIGSDFLGAYFDVGNIIYIGYPDQWIEILGHRIKRLHFCDCRGEQAGLGMFVDLFEGDVDFKAVMKAVRDIGYDSWATVEFLPNYRMFPYQSVINARLSLKRILEEM